MIHKSNQQHILWLGIRCRFLVLVSNVWWEVIYLTHTAHLKSWLAVCQSIQPRHLTTYQDSNHQCFKCLSVFLLLFVSCAPNLASNIVQQAWGNVLLALLHLPGFGLPVCQTRSEPAHPPPPFKTEPAEPKSGSKILKFLRDLSHLMQWCITQKWHWIFHEEVRLKTWLRKLGINPQGWYLSIHSIINTRMPAQTSFDTDYCHPTQQNLGNWVYSCGIIESRKEKQTHSVIWNMRKVQVLVNISSVAWR